MEEEESLIEMLKSADAAVRREACERLQAAPVLSPEAILALENALQDADQSVAERAETALRAHRPIDETANAGEVVSQNPPTTRKKRSPLKTALLLVLLLIPAALCGPRLLLMLTGCNDLITTNPPVEIQPLIELEIPATMDLTHWANIARGQEGIYLASAHYEATVQRYSSVGEASSEFDLLTNLVATSPCPPNSKFGGAGTNRYCISPIETDRLSADALCESTGTYDSSALIQKEDVLIVIRVHSAHRNSADMDAAIASLAQELQQAITPADASCNIEVTAGIYYSHSGGRLPTNTVYCLPVSDNTTEITLGVWVDMADGKVTWSLTDPLGATRLSHEVTGASDEFPNFPDPPAFNPLPAIPGVWHLEVVTSDMAGKYILMWNEIP